MHDVLVLHLQVKADSYNTHQQLLLHIEYANKPSQNSEPIYLQVAHQQELKKALSQSKSILEKLGRFAALINQMTVQSLVMVFQKDVTSFHTDVWKVTRAFLLIMLVILKIKEAIVEMMYFFYASEENMPAVHSVQH